MKTFVGADPGPRNFGYSIIDAAKTKSSKLQFELLEIGMFTDTITNLTPKPVKPPKSRQRKRQPDLMEAAFPEQIDTYHTEWVEIIKDYRPVKLTSERFQARGLKGSAIECVNMMNGMTCLIAHSNGIKFEILTAATWKNQVNRISDLELIYKEVSVPPHSVDACFIAIYGALSYFGLAWCDLDIDDVFTQLLAFTYEKVKQ